MEEGSNWGAAQQYDLSPKVILVLTFGDANKILSGMVFLDFRKAFDVVDHCFLRNCACIE